MSPPGEPAPRADAGQAPATQREAAPPVRRPVFHVFEEFYRRAVRGEPRPRPARGAARTA